MYVEIHEDSSTALTRLSLKAGIFHLLLHGLEELGICLRPLELVIEELHRRQLIHRGRPERHFLRRFADQRNGPPHLDRQDRHPRGRLPDQQRRAGAQLGRG